MAKAQQTLADIYENRNQQVAERLVTSAGNQNMTSFFEGLDYASGPFPKKPKVDTVRRSMAVHASPGFQDSKLPSTNLSR